jgi:hypothetical protein
MLWVIVAVVVVGAIFAFGTLVGSSVAQNLAGDRARQGVRDEQRRSRSSLSARAVMGEPLTQP